MPVTPNKWVLVFNSLDSIGLEGIGAEEEHAAAAAKMAIRFCSILFYSFFLLFVHSQHACWGWLVDLKMERKERKSQSVILCPTGACRVIQFGAQPPPQLRCRNTRLFVTWCSRFPYFNSILPVLTHPLPEWHVHVFVDWNLVEEWEVTPVLMSKEHLLACNTMFQVSSFHQHLAGFSRFSHFISTYVYSCRVLILIRYLPAAYLPNFLSPINCQNDMCMWFGLSCQLKSGRVRCYSIVDEWPAYWWWNVSHSLSHWSCRVPHLVAGSSFQVSRFSPFINTQLIDSLILRTRCLHSTKSSILSHLYYCQNVMCMGELVN